MGKATITDAIVNVKADELCSRIKDELKKKQVSNILVVKESSQCIEGLDRFPKALLIVDWDLGSSEVAKILTAAKIQLKNRIVLLFTKEVEIYAVTTAAEYGVAAIHSGETSNDRIASSIGNAIRAEMNIADFKDSLSQSVRARAKGKFDTAEGILKKLQKENPDSLRLKVEIAETLIEQERIDDALLQLKGMDSKDPPYLRGLHLMARCLMKKGEYERAIELMTKANLFNPHNATRLVDIGKAYLQLDNLTEAREQFDTALELSPGDRDAAIGKGQCYLMEDDVNEALSLLKEVAGGAELASIFNISAIMSMRQKRFETGMNLYQAAIKALGEDSKIHAKLAFNMGLGYQRWNKPEEASQCFDKALSLDPAFEKVKTARAKLRSEPPLAVPADGSPSPLSEKLSDEQDIDNIDEVRLFAS